MKCERGARLPCRKRRVGPAKAKLGLRPRTRERSRRRVGRVADVFEATAQRVRR